MRVKASRAVERLMVTGDGSGVANHAGAVLVAELADRVGLTTSLGEAMAATRQRDKGHDPGVVLTQLAVSLVDGGECVSDLRVLRDQPDLFGQVASTPTVSRTLYSIDAGVLDSEAAGLRLWAQPSTAGYSFGSYERMLQISAGDINRIVVNNLRGDELRINDALVGNEFDGY